MSPASIISNENLLEKMNLLKKIVKNNSTNDTNHIDFGLVPTEKREMYENALKEIKLSIMKGELSQEDFINYLNLK